MERIKSTKPSLVRAVTQAVVWLGRLHMHSDRRQTRESLDVVAEGP